MERSVPMCHNILTVSKNVPNMSTSLEEEMLIEYFFPWRIQLENDEFIFDEPKVFSLWFQISKKYDVNVRDREAIQESCSF